MSDSNMAALLGGVVLGIALYWFRTTPRMMRRAAACLIRRAAAVEAAEIARKRAGDAAYVLACEYLELEVEQCKATTSVVPPGAATDEI